MVNICVLHFAIGSQTPLNNTRHIVGTRVHLFEKVSSSHRAPAALGTSGGRRRGPSPGAANGRSVGSRHLAMSTIYFEECVQQTHTHTSPAHILS